MKCLTSLTFYLFPQLLNKFNKTRVLMLDPLYILLGRHFNYVSVKGRGGVGGGNKI